MGHFLKSFCAPFKFLNMGRGKPILKEIKRKTAPAASPSKVYEEPNYYSSGGFYRVSLGEKLNNNQYTILRKIGYGQYSTVWLAHDTK